jgi:hypothetical protein
MRWPLSRNGKSRRFALVGLFGLYCNAGCSATIAEPANGEDNNSQDESVEHSSAETSASSGTGDNENEDEGESETEDSSTDSGQTATSTPTTETTQTTSEEQDSDAESSTQESSENDESTQDTDHCQSDEDCRDDTAHPLCNAKTGQCVACLEDTGCTDPARPYCEPSLGECVECLRDNECPDTAPNCINHSCGLCTELIGHCGDAACDLKNGRCLPADQIWWASASAGCNDTIGTKETPFCRPIVGLNHLRSSPDKRGTLYLEGKLDRTMVFNDGGTYAIVSEKGLSLQGDWNGTPDALRVEKNTTLYTQGFQLSSEAGIGAVCSGSNLLLEKANIASTWSHGVNANECTLWIYDSKISNAQGSGIVQSNGTLNILRSIVWNNFQDGVQVNGGDVNVTNSFLATNGAGGGAVASLVLNGTNATIRYTSFAHRTTTANTQIICRKNDAPKITNSIAVGGQDATFSGCSLESIANSVVDVAALKDKNNNFVVETVPDAGAWFKAPNANPPDLHLKSAMDAEVVKLKDIAKRDEADPGSDIDLQARPAAGEKDWPGADIPE